MQHLQAFEQSLRGIAQYYPIEYDVIYGFDKTTRTWKSWSIKMDQCHEKQLAAAAQADGGRISRCNGFFVD